MATTEGVISKETLRRIISDISTIVKNPLHDNGIYYEHDEVNILKGYVLIIPQSENTPYQYGNYLFSIDFPQNYPYSPPKMTYLTNNGKTRFHPNLYRNGKVCLSLLNTWKGEQWTSCNTLSSILLNIATLFTNDPFLHEPGITENHESFDDYTKVIEYQNCSTSIYEVLTDSKFMNFVGCAGESFKKVIHDNYIKHKDEIIKKVQNYAYSSNYTLMIDIPFYKMYDEYLDYNKLYVKLKEYNEKLI